MPIQSFGRLFPGCFSSNLPVPQVAVGAALFVASGLILQAAPGQRQAANAETDKGCG